MNRHSVVLPDGTTDTRNSKSRTYSHAVACYIPAAEVARQKRDGAKHQRDMVAKYRREFDALAAKWGADKVQNWIDKGEAAADRLDAEAAVAVDSDWYITGWTSRLDLAQKLAAQKAGKNYVVRILDAELKGSK